LQRQRHRQSAFGRNRLRHQLSWNRAPVTLRRFHYQPQLGLVVLLGPRCRYKAV
jgi:hypothetical protein